MPKLTRNDWQNAYYSQSAVNLSGLVHSLTEVLPRIWEEAQAVQGGTAYVNEHPIVRLYTAQMCWLAYRESMPMTLYTEAMREVRHALGDVTDSGGEKSETGRGGPGEQWPVEATPEG